MSQTDARTWSGDYDAMMRQYYAQRADHYDETYQRPERQSDLALIKTRLALAFAHRRVLDVACGTGYWSEVFAPAAESVVGIDANEPVLAHAREKQIPRAEFIREEAYALPESLGHFDAAMLGFWWSHIPKHQLKPFSDQLHRRLRPGSRVIILDNRYVPGNSTPIAHTDEDGNSWQIRPSPNDIFYRVLKNYPQYAEMLAHLAPLARQTHWWSLNYYWWFEYILR